MSEWDSITQRHQALGVRRQVKDRAEKWSADYADSTDYEKLKTKGHRASRWDGDGVALSR